MKLQVIYDQLESLEVQGLNFRQSTWHAIGQLANIFSFVGVPILGSCYIYDQLVMICCVHVALLDRQTRSQMAMGHTM